LVATRPGPMENCLERVGDEKAGSWSAEAVTLLLQYGAKVDMPLSPTQTLLHYVFQHAPASTLQAFLDHSGLDMNIRDQTGRSVFLAACDSKIRSDTWVF